MINLPLLMNALDTVIQINSLAKARGAAESVLQFENICTHAQYVLAYELTRQTIRSGDHVLDWGCGNGHFSFFLTQLGASVTGYSFEPAPRIMAESDRFSFVAGSAADPRSLPFPDSSFDAAVGVGVIEHVWETGGDEPASLAELARVVRPGGTLLTFHLPNIGGAVENVVKALGLKKYVHGRRFDEPQIRKLWRSAGFTVTAIGLYNPLPRAELRRLPRAVRQSRWFAHAFGLLDSALAAAAPRICTNFYVVATRD